MTLTGSNNNRQFGLSNVVNFNTREDAMLDLILTDISSYKSCENLAPIANNDHCCILLRGEGNLPSCYVKKQKRLVTHPRKLMVLKDLAEQSWSSVLNAQDINSKVNLMHDTISKILDKHCPIKTT